MLERNIHKGRCLVCGRVVYANEGFRRMVRGRGYRIFCCDHADSLMSYHGSEVLRADSVGTTKKTPLARTTVGVEIETDASDRHNAKYLRFRGTLERVGFVFESDCTVRTGEAPSPVMNGLATISAILRNNQDVIDELFTDNTGAHVHVACDDVSYIRRYYHSIFVPFCEYLESHSDEWLVENFGSSFRHYASRITRNTDAMNHSNVVNVQHGSTLEFRLPRIREYRQFVKVVKFWRMVGFELNNFDFHKTAESNAERLALARQAGRMVVEIATKFYGV